MTLSQKIVKHTAMATPDVARMPTIECRSSQSAMTFTASIAYMATPDVAPMPPIESCSDQSAMISTASICPDQSAIIRTASIANSFICEYRGDITRRWLASLAVSTFLLIILSISNTNASFSKETNSKPVNPTQLFQLTHLCNSKNRTPFYRPLEVAQRPGAKASRRLFQERTNISRRDAGASGMLLAEKVISPNSISDEHGEMTDSGDVALPKEMTDSGNPAPQTGEQHVTDLKDQTGLQNANQLQGAAQVQTNEQNDASLIADEEDRRVKRFSRFLPPQWQNAIVQSRKHTRRGPMVVFRHWASERKPFIPTFLFCLFFGLVGSAFFPKQVAVAQACCRSQFWRCLGRAMLAGIMLVTTVRILELIMIAQALCTVLLSILEVGIIAGLSVGVMLVGEGITRGKLSKVNYFANHPRVETFTKVLIGSLILALIVQIPGAGLLPRIGIRIALLVAILGAGGLLKTKFGTQPVSAD